MSVSDETPGKCSEVEGPTKRLEDTCTVRLLLLVQPRQVCYEQLEDVELQLVTKAQNLVSALDAPTSRPKV